MQNAFEQKKQSIEMRKKSNCLKRKKLLETIELETIEI